MWLPIIGLIVGLFLGFLTDIKIPVEYSNYLSIAVLAALDMMKKYLFLVFSLILF